MTVETQEIPFLDTVEGEISFFRSVMRARPVGMHRHFHVLAIRNAIMKDTGQNVSIDNIWQKLRSLWNLDMLESLDIEGYESPGSSQSTPASIGSPSAADNLNSHAFFKNEYSLPPNDEFIDNMISSRRIRETASPETFSPAAASPVPHKTRQTSKKRGKSKLDMAGLVGGDSDSSALTDSGDDAAGRTSRSAATGTDAAGTDYVEEEESEIREPSPAHSQSTAPKQGKRGAQKGRRGMGSGRGRGATSTRGPKKRKR